MDYLTIVGSIVGIISGVVTTIPVLNKFIFRKKQLNNKFQNNLDNSNKRKSNSIIQIFNFNEFNSINYVDKNETEVENYKSLKKYVYRVLTYLSLFFVIYIFYINWQKFGTVNFLNLFLSKDKLFLLILYISKNVCFYTIIIQIILSSLVVLKMVVYKNSNYRIFNIWVYVITTILSILFFYYFNSITIEQIINKYIYEEYILVFMALVSVIQLTVIMLFNIETYVILLLGELKSASLENTKNFNLWKIILLFLLLLSIIFWYYIK